MDRNKINNIFESMLYDIEYIKKLSRFVKRL